MSFESALDLAIRTLRQRRMRKAMVSPELRKGIATELEHASTVRKIQRNPKMPAKKAAELIARDHLKERGDYYDALDAVEGKVKKQRGLKAPRIKLLGRRGKVRIYLVATTPTKRIYVDWTEGGHDVVYAFVPKNEVWISDNLPPLEILLTQIHELRERRRMIELMREGMSRTDAYDKAHDESLAVEDKYRKANGRGLKSALARERGQ